MEANGLITGLFAFLDALPAPRFQAGPREKLAIQELIFRLIEEQVWTGDERALKTLIAPVVCGTRAAQDEFYARFDEWAEQRKRQPPPAPDGPGAGGNKGGSADDPPKWPTAVAVGLVLLVILAFAAKDCIQELYQPIDPPPFPKAPSVPPPRRPQSRTGRIEGRVTANNQPVKDATVWLPATLSSPPYPSVRTDSDGKFAVYPVPVAGYNLLITHPNHQPTFVQGVRPGQEADQIDLRPKVTSVVTRERIPPIPRFPLWVSLAFACLTPLALLAWLLWKDRAERRYLEQWETAHDLKPLRVQTGWSEQELFQGAEVAGLARSLQRRVARPTGLLAIEPTIEATAGRCGIFTPVHLERQASREYLVLVERRGPRDQQARLWTAFLKRLADRNVYVDIYFYATDPRLCEPLGRERVWIRLDELAAIHSQHDLWILADPSRFFDPFTGEPSPWVASLRRWSEPVALTLVEPGEHARERLGRLGFRLAQGTVAGLAALAATEPSGEASQEMPGAYPRLLREDELRWLDSRDPPDKAEVRKLDRQIRAWLGGDGYQCLLACAVYPGLAWNLTLHLAIHLIPERREETLARLVRLVWFRHGRMPRWLREFLVAKLEHQDVERILGLLRKYLDAPRRQPGPDESLEFVPKKETDDPGTKPTHDYVFLAALQGRKPKAADIAAPTWLMRLLYPEGRRDLGVRGAVLASSALAAMPLLFVGAQWAAQAGIVEQTVERETAQASSPLDRTAAHPLMARAVEIAASQVGTGGQAFPGRLLEWSRDRARELAGVDVPFASGGVIEQRRGAALPPSVRPGWIWEPTGSAALPSWVEQVFADSLVTVEERPGKAVRSLWRFSEMEGRFLVPDAAVVTSAPGKPPFVHSDGLTYRWIPPGRFEMGCSPGDDLCRNDESPRHPVEITRGFWIGETEVTQGAYQKMTGENPSDFKGPKRPVERVSWDDARKYCAAVGLRLPTEAEWEYAARAGSKDARYGPLDQIAWYGDNSGRKRLNTTEMWAKNIGGYIEALKENGNGTHAVGTKGMNGWGLYDTLGNVWEWVADRYDQGYYKQGAARIDPSGPSTGEQRVLRGGSWVDLPEGVRVSYRYRVGPTFRDDNFGFRCAGELR